MEARNGALVLSAHDLSNHLGCRHLTQLDRAVADGQAAAPDWRDPGLAALQERGLEFEAAYLRHLIDARFDVSIPCDNQTEIQTSIERTINEMVAGRDVIFQAAFQDDRWFGRADFLIKVDTPSELGSWSYEVLDTKLARETRAATVLQLCLYSGLIARIQGKLPEFTHVVAPGEPFEKTPFRVKDYYSYFHLVQSHLVAALDRGEQAMDTYPDPVPHCEVCRWWSSCDRRRRDDDHLCIVAGVSRLHVRELRNWGVNSLTALAELPVPLVQRPARGATATYERLREQARIQHQARVANISLLERLPIVEGKGVCTLPEPTAGDVFFDIEGDPFAGQHGLEYLFGWVHGKAGDYKSVWAHDAASEKAAFENFIDFAVNQLEVFPGMHIYHFTGYEPGALKRLMGRYVTREDELDRLLRGQRFVDLHAVVRQAVRLSVERYSLKELEVFYAFNRSVPLTEATLHRRAYERALELRRLDMLSGETASVVEGYNRDDCASTRELRDWLEEIRRRSIEMGADVPRPELAAGDPSAKLDERQRVINALYDRLAGDVPVNPEERNPEQQARWLLANMLDWHRREKKASWWEYHRLCELSDEELLDEKAGLSGLQFQERMGRPALSVVDRYEFPAQECELRAGDKLKDSGGKNFGSIETIDVVGRTIDIKKGPTNAEAHPSSVFKHDDIPVTVKHEAIMRLGYWVAENGMDAAGPYRAARDLLLRRLPRPGREAGANKPSLMAARDWVDTLDESILPIQGPPGAGKTYTGAHMITHLVRARKKVGVVALSHRVIRNLLDNVIEVGEVERTTVHCVHKVTTLSNAESAIEEITDNAAVAHALSSGHTQVVGGTAWLWSRPELFEAVDVLFVDEAGQLSLVDVVAVSQAAKNLVLLGDPQQLKQPVQGSHPDGTEVSALEHVLGEAQTMPEERGLFLAETFRLHPAICDFISEQFYDFRLGPHANLHRQALSGDTRIQGSGLWLLPVPHDGNQSSSSEEVDAVAGLVDELASGSVVWTDAKTDLRTLTLDDILIITPYNAQVAAIAERMPKARVGTVDLFQGQQAPVVIFSMATSSPEDAPRGMEFLYSRNRLNVAVSRAQAACIVVASPRLFEPDCQSPAQMRLANAFCRYMELARPLDLPAES